MNKNQQFYHINKDMNLNGSKLSKGDTLSLEMRNPDSPDKYLLIHKTDNKGNIKSLGVETVPPHIKKILDEVNQKTYSDALSIVQGLNIPKDMSAPEALRSGLHKYADESLQKGKRSGIPQVTVKAVYEVKADNLSFQNASATGFKKGDMLGIVEEKNPDGSKKQYFGKLGKDGKVDYFKVEDEKTGFKLMDEMNDLSAKGWMSRGNVINYGNDSLQMTMKNAVNRKKDDDLKISRGQKDQLKPTVTLSHIVVKDDSIFDDISDMKTGKKDVISLEVRQYRNGYVEEKMSHIDKSGKATTLEEFHGKAKSDNSITKKLDGYEAKKKLEYKEVYKTEDMKVDGHEVMSQYAKSRPSEDLSERVEKRSEPKKEKHEKKSSFPSPSPKW